MTDSRDFEQLLERHWGIVRKIACLYAPNRDEWEDLAQEICLQLWRSYGRYDPARPFATWMYRVALNTAISAARSSRHRAPSTAPLQKIDVAVHDRTDDATGDRRERLYRLIHGLDELTRALVLLHLEGHTHREIAEILGISETNVSTRLSRFRAQARRGVAQSPEEGTAERGTS